MPQPTTLTRPPRGCGYAAGRATRAPIISARRRANLRNASRSTGPRTAAGKAASSRNALRHGLRSSAPMPLAEVRPVAVALGSSPMAWVAAELLVLESRIRARKCDAFGYDADNDVVIWRPEVMTLFSYERKTRSLRDRAFRAMIREEDAKWPNEANRAPGLMR